MVGHSRHSWLLHARISRCIRDALNLHGLRRSPRFGFNSLPFIWKYMRLRYRHDKNHEFPDFNDGHDRQSCKKWMSRKRLKKALNSLKSIMMGGDSIDRLFSLGCEHVDWSTKFLKSLENATCFVSISRNKLLYYDLFILLLYFSTLYCE